MAETVQERLYQAFISRRYGLLSDDTLLVMLGCILRGAPRNFADVRLRSCEDLRKLTAEQAEEAFWIIPTLDIRHDPNVALQLLAAEIRTPRA